MTIAIVLAIYLFSSSTIYFVRENGQYASASISPTEFSNRLCIRLLPSDDEAEKILGVDFGIRVPPSAIPLVCRPSVADDRIWIAEVVESRTSGLYGKAFYTQIHRFSIENMKEGRISPAQFVDVTMSKAESSSTKLESIFTTVLSDVENNISFDLHPKNTDARYGWGLAPYYSVWRKTVHGGRQTDPMYVSIAAVSSNVAIAYIYSGQKIAFVKLHARQLSPEELNKYKPTMLPFHDPESDALEWSSLGFTETGIDTWSTGFWVNDSLWIVADDGSYENFKIVQGKMQRVIHSVKFDLPPHWMLRAKSGVWILSQSVDEVRAIELSKVSWWQSNGYSMGNISLDKAAVKVFEENGE